MVAVVVVFQQSVSQTFNRAEYASERARSIFANAYKSNRFGLLADSFFWRLFITKERLVTNGTDGLSDCELRIELDQAS